jgi:hypothetical protein
MPKKRVELGVNITPAVVLLFGSAPQNVRLGGFLKYQVQPNKQIRTMFNYEIEDRYNRRLNESPVSWTDSTIIIDYESRNNYRYDMRIGLEFTKPNVPFTMAYGFDVLVGVRHEERTTVRKELYEDPEYDYELVPSPFTPETTGFAQVDYLYFGADFSFGPKFNFNDNVNFMIQWSPELLVERPIREEYSSPQERERAPASSFNFRLRGIEAFLQFRF